ncbi:MAG: Maf family protein, partial [Acetobacteraceae bacterium]
MTLPPLLLASTSQRRAKLLAAIGVVPERVFSPLIDEAPAKGEKPAALALRLARAKAASAPRDGRFVLAAD